MGILALVAADQDVGMIMDGLGVAGPGSGSDGSGRDVWVRPLWMHLCLP